MIKAITIRIGRHILCLRFFIKKTSCRLSNSASFKSTTANVRHASACRWFKPSTLCLRRRSESVTRQTQVCRTLFRHLPVGLHWNRQQPSIHSTLAAHPSRFDILCSIISSVCRALCNSRLCKNPAITPDKPVAAFLRL